MYGNRSNYKDNVCKYWDMERICVWKYNEIQGICMEVYGMSGIGMEIYEHVRNGRAWIYIYIHIYI